jgi:hypothetical protein
MSDEPQTVFDGEIADAGGPTAEPMSNAADGFFEKMDNRLDLWSDRLNPILIKQTRQALKSRQFLTTFFMMLICVWGWSLLSIAIQATGNDVSVGPTTLHGFFIVLIVPMIVIVPYTAFRSLALEREDGTHELLSITTLGARQIILGKLGSAVLQMMLFYSILAPCIAFTYLLRGVDVIAIALLLWYTLVNSIILSSLGLLLASAARANHWRILLSLMLLGALVAAGFAWMAGGYGIIWEIEFDAMGAPFWYAQAFINVMAVCFIVLFLQAAAGQISFASDNRSTKPRITMVVQTMLYTGWASAFILATPYEGPELAGIVVLGVFWTVMGALLVGEIGTLSPRVRRTLPQTGLGRALFTWFTPGGGTGYLLTVCTTFAGIGTLTLACRLNDETSNDVVYRCAPLLFLYITSYIGAARLIVAATSRWSQPGPLGSFVITATLLTFGALLPAVGQLLAIRIIGEDYTVLQAPNWLWSLMEAGQRNTAELHLTIGTMCVVAGVIFIVNLAATAREVEQYHVTAPRRVREEDAAEQPQLETIVAPHPLDVVDDPV